MILEGIVTTVGPDGRLNVAPMGPRIEPGWRRFELRPFATSTTYGNLKAHGEGVLHVTDDVLLLARAALGLADDTPTRPAEVVRGRILEESCRHYEFRVEFPEEVPERVSLMATVVAEGHSRDYFGLNRAKHAVVEAAILATRTAILPLDEILVEFRRLAVPVEKTGGVQERAAFTLLREHVQRASQASGLDLDSQVS